jgi:hypothetical protein
MGELFAGSAERKSDKKQTNKKADTEYSVETNISEREGVNKS